MGGAVTAIVGVGGALVGAIATVVVQGRALRHERREALRAVYGEILVRQRRSREASMAAAEAEKDARDQLLREAREAHAEFIDTYHQLNLDADPRMWVEVRVLRHVLDDMPLAAEGRNEDLCERLTDFARQARQNLEGAFRETFHHRFHKSLQQRKSLPQQFDKQARGSIVP